MKKSKEHFKGCFSVIIVYQAAFSRLKKMLEKYQACDKMYIYNRKSFWEGRESVQANLKGSKGSCYTG